MIEDVPSEDRVSCSCTTIENKYPGKWVFTVNVKFTEHMEFVEGTPVIIADSAYEGLDRGVYDKFNDEKKYGVVHGYDMTPHFKVLVSNG